VIIVDQMATGRSDALATARRYHGAWWGSDFDTAAGCLATDLQIEVPINAYSTGAAFIQAVRQTRDMASTLEMVCELGSPTDAVLIYDMTLPIGVLRVVEHFTVSDGHITRIRQIHDTAALRAAGLGEQGSEQGRPPGDSE
jgi:hypothetical protein